MLSGESRMRLDSLGPKWNVVVVVVMVVVVVG